jgi:hypothetical protein
VVLDASLSSDPDNDPLQFAWLEEGTIIATGVVVRIDLEIGTHTITLAADDGTVTSTEAVAFEVITAGDAMDEIIARIENSTLPDSVRRTLVASLEPAKAALEVGNFDTGAHLLDIFELKVEMRVAPDDPALATLLINAAQEVIDAVGVP